MNCRGRRIVITGASSGLGAALAEVLAARGAVLLLAARRGDALTRVAAGVPRGPAGAPLVVPCDVTAPESVRELVRVACGELGGIDVLLNNAAVSVYGETDRTSVSDYREMMDVNFHGPVRLALEVLPGLLEQGSGRILNILSVAALHGLPYLAAYGASKAALAAFGQSLRAELAGTGVRIQNVYPDYIDTPLFAKERRVGSAHRPPHGYAPPRRVAEEVVRALEKGREETVLSVRGKLLRGIGGLYPGLVDRALARMARRLWASEVNDHETNQASHHRPLSESR